MLIIEHGDLNSESGPLSLELAQDGILLKLTYVTNLTSHELSRRDRTVFNTEVNGATFDDTTHTWTVTTVQGDVVVSKFLFLANGVLSTPATPGMTSDFNGVEFHTCVCCSFWTLRLQF